MTFQDFKNSRLDAVAQQYLAEILNNTDLTLGQLKDALNDDSLSPYMDMTLGRVFNHQTTTPRTIRVRDRRTVAQLVMAHLKSYHRHSPSEYLSAHDIVEAIDTSTAQYVNKLCQDGVKDNTLPLSMTYRQEHNSGSPTPVYRYIPELDSEKRY